MSLWMLWGGEGQMTAMIKTSKEVATETQAVVVQRGNHQRE